MKPRSPLPLELLPWSDGAETGVDDEGGGGVAGATRLSGSEVGRLVQRRFLIIQKYLSLIGRKETPEWLRITSQNVFFICKYVYTVKKVIDFHVLSRDVTYQTLPGGE